MARRWCAKPLAATPRAGTHAKRELAAHRAPRDATLYAGGPTRSSRWAGPRAGIQNPGDRSAPNRSPPHIAVPDRRCRPMALLSPQKYGPHSRETRVFVKQTGRDEKETFRHRRSTVPGCPHCRQKCDDQPPPWGTAKRWIMSSPASQRKPACWRIEDRIAIRARDLSASGTMTLAGGSNFSVDLETNFPPHRQEP